MKVDRELTNHLAGLSKFEMGEEEAESLAQDLNRILDYISMLDELDTDNIKPTYQVSFLENVWRPDEILGQDASREELLALTKEVEDNQVKVPRVL